ncbi:unnamed protein product [Brassica napus]|uniref:(rape) hypothetical protein n=1 Tax=Brassica napus TaxID=3708 RepID=A0A816XK58_BRANA|nr:unnamed protein product [Brassica napus]
MVSELQSIHGSYFFFFFSRASAYCLKQGKKSFVFSVKPLLLL